MIYSETGAVNSMRISLSINGNPQYMAALSERFSASHWTK
jgi:hypothetical protein